VFEWQTDRVEAVYQLIQTRLSTLFFQRSVYGGILVGGRSSRMGKHKQLIEMDGMSWSERGAEILLPHVRELCILGAGPLPEPLNRYPRLPDAPGFEGPAGGLVSAMRWQPNGSWIFAACDMPLITPEAIEWLLAQRRPGCWGVVPVNQTGIPEPLFAWYDPRLLPALVNAGYPIALVDHPKVRTPSVPSDVSTSWRNFNTPEDLQGNEPATSTVD
jgi:molybdopterin-guanine dinucleotide biosynthesis protein A